MDPDDVAYKKSVRNMSIVLAAMAITIFAALLVPAYIYPRQDGFQASVSLYSPFGFGLHLLINTTSPPAAGRVLLTGWINSTAGSIENISAADAWPVGPAGMWGRTCTHGWPIALGLMKGHFDQDNYTLGTLLPIPQPQCALQEAPPAYLLLEPSPHSSKALVDIGGTPQFWVVQSNYTLSYAALVGLDAGGGGIQFPPGVYTVLAADEWGDLLTTNFAVS
jgi:hypothetical protein